MRFVPGTDVDPETIELCDILKTRYPLTPIEQYAAWRRDDGSHLDPWLRAHERVGGRIFGPAEDAMVIEGSRDEWEDWTEMAFPADGRVRRAGRARAGSLRGFVRHLPGAVRLGRARRGLAG